ncbi:MAG: amidohydrolase [Deltaproteobacteria bacterium]|nr:amidohydrolase [Deltaproteobacteria bacterium]
MIIDSHVHIFPSEMRHKRHELLCLEEGFRGLYRHNNARMVGADDVIRMLDEERIDRAVVFGFPWQEVGLCKQGNDYVLESVNKYPDRLIGFITVPWKSSDAVLKECERGLNAGGKGVGELALYHQTVDGASFDLLEPLAELLQKKQRPLLLHVNEPVGHDYPGKSLTDFKALYTFIAAHPYLSIILAHWGGGFFFYELMPEIRRLSRNVFYDTAASPFLYDKSVYFAAVSIVGEDRILFGSDYPLLSPQRYCEELNQTTLSQEVRTKIQGENARILLGIS